MLKKVLFVGGLSILFAGCVSPKKMTPPPASGSATVPVIDQRKGSHQSGTALVEQQGENVHVFVKIKGADASTLPVTLNLGDCSEPKDVKFALSDTVGGNSDTLLKKTQLGDVWGLAVVVHAAKDNPAMASCGMLQ